MQDKWYTKQYIDEQERKANKVLTVLGSFLVTDVKLRVPVDTGNLKGSITMEQENLVVAVGTNVEYAPHVEFGTEKMDAQPYLKPALEENKDQLQKGFVRLMRK